MELSEQSFAVPKVTFEAPSGALEDPFVDFGRLRGTDFDRLRASGSERAVSRCSGCGTQRKRTAPKPKKLEKCRKLCLSR